MSLEHIKRKMLENMHVSDFPKTKKSVIFSLMSRLLHKMSSKDREQKAYGLLKAGGDPNPCISALRRMTTVWTSDKSTYAHLLTARD